MPTSVTPYGRRSAAACAVLGLAASAAIVWQASHAAFSATTTNPTDNWTAGTVNLNADLNASALFTVAPIKPGATGTKCIRVTSTGNLPGAVRMYATAGTFAQTNAVSDNLTLTITVGTGGIGGGSCSGFTPDAGPITTTTTTTSFATTYTNYGNGFGTWTTNGGTVVRCYQIQWTFNSAAPNTTQAGTASLGFTWELQNS